MRGCTCSGVNGSVEEQIPDNVDEWLNDEGPIADRQRDEADELNRPDGPPPGLKQSRDRTLHQAIADQVVLVVVAEVGEEGLADRFAGCVAQANVHPRGQSTLLVVEDRRALRSALDRDQQPPFSCCADRVEGAGLGELVVGTQRRGERDEQPEPPPADAHHPGAPDQADRALADGQQAHRALAEDEQPHRALTDRHDADRDLTERKDAGRLLSDGDDAVRFPTYVDQLHVDVSYTGSTAEVGMLVCRECGARALPGSSGCGICGSREAPIRAPAPTAERYFVGIRARFQCRSCGQMSPIDSLHLQRSIVCLCCGQVQAFEIDLWKEGAHAAQAVGDLAGPEHEGRDRDPLVAIDAINPLRDIGVTRSSHEHQRNDTAIVEGVHQRRSLFVEAFPGHPLCETCHHPVRVYVRRSEIQTRCPECGEEATYKNPSAIISGMQGVMDEVHRTDRPEVVVSDGRAKGLSCSSCGGPLEVEPGALLVKCGFCRLVSRVPDRVRANTLANPRPAVWWMIFGGRSAQRQALMRGPAEDNRREIEPPPTDPKPPSLVRLRQAVGVWGIPLLILVVVGILVSGLQLLVG